MFYFDELEYPYTITDEVITITVDDYVFVIGLDEIFESFISDDVEIIYDIELGEYNVKSYDSLGEVITENSYSRVYFYQNICEQYFDKEVYWNARSLRSAYFSDSMN